MLKPIGFPYYNWTKRCCVQLIPTNNWNSLFVVVVLLFFAFHILVVSELLNVGSGGFDLVAEHGAERGGKLLMRLSVLTPGVTVPPFGQ